MSCEQNNADQPPAVGMLVPMSLLAMLMILAVELYPFDFQSCAGRRWLALADWDPLGLIRIAILFVPLGFFEARLAGVMLWRTFGAADDSPAGVSSGRGNLVMLLTIIDAALLGLVVETLQLWLPAAQSSAVDMVANMIGGTVGGMVACMSRSSGAAGDSE